MKKISSLCLILFSLLAFSCSSRSEKLEQAIATYEADNNKDNLVRLIMIAMGDGDGPLSVQYSKVLYDMDPDNLEYKCLYAASLGVYAGYTNDQTEKVEYGSHSFNILNEAIMDEPENYVPYMYRGLAGARSPKWLKFYIKSIKDFEKIFELAAKGKIPEDRRQSTLSLAFEGYVKSLEMNGEEDRIAQVTADFKAQFPDIKIIEE